MSNNKRRRKKKMQFLYELINNDTFKVLGLVIGMDLIFGILRALREKNVNSCIGIDGMIRKCGMLIAVIFLSLIDRIINIDFLGFIPTDLKTILKIEKIGISSLFSMLFIIFEILSIFKNMILCKLPIPKKLQLYLERVMKEFTGEIKESEVKENGK